ncbi:MULTISPECIES: amino acid ABC transporter substrate-binding protein [unclassified Pseudomonas]|jgi:polar amino acid transport system substrate-binding protein|uniref:amino acid ABC transporter substrate-binding protein n=1 Tax=unclassified Pseudomonas TaxID=196821 RepID=UPI000C87FE91|nr:MULTISPECIES: amino acid ABC transporter substrate-binding protein [unclassified Pseudomonas]PMZ93114.1 amino acid ABC transporter substrate-binding protein [Pseudomonas sp. FW215-T2]PNA13006.1 amino acid ABC transporter substrate-binding protein [Pseudomonas sp. FW215-R3]PNB36521.1 amino acid ABC transporter substrate-binding protein [Pseudomonas sp. FW305-131]
MSAQPTKAANLLLVCLLSLAPAIAGADTLERVRNSNSVVLGYVPDFAPFSTQAGDKASGYAIDLCQDIFNTIKTELNLPSLQVRYQPVQLGEEISAVSTGKVDILCTPTPVTLERRKTVSYSIPVYTAGLSAVVNKKASNALLKVLNGDVAKTGPTWRTDINRALANMTYATIAGGVTEQWINQQMRALGVVATLVTVQDTAAGLQRVADGKADVFFAERTMLKHDLADQYATGNLVLLDRIFEYATTSMMVDRDDENFRLLVDGALSEMYRSGAIEQAYDKHLGGVSDTSRMLFKLYALP